MKSYIFLLLTLSLSVVSVDVNGQDPNFSEPHAKFKIKRSISLNGDSQKDTVLLKVEKETSILELQIMSRVKQGDLTIEIYNPAGEKEGNYSVGSQLKSNKMNGSGDKQEVVHGEINRRLIEPMVGDWKIAVIPKNAKGDVGISSLQYIQVSK